MPHLVQLPNDNTKLVCGAARLDIALHLQGLQCAHTIRGAKIYSLADKYNNMCKNIT